MINKSPQFYLVKCGDLWGDFGDILVHGMAGLDEVSDVLELDRAGPFLPPITLPAFGGVCISNSIRPNCESAFPYLSFREVHKRKIVNIPWETWDLTAEEPLIYPETGEPDDYITLGVDSPDAAAALGSIWQIVFPTRVTMKLWPHERSWLAPRSIIKATWDRTDFFGAWVNDVGQWPVVTERGKNFLLEHAERWLSFKPLPPEEEMPNADG